jgi:hypothetical protein
MYSNKLNLKFLKLILFSEKMQLQKLKALWDSNTRPAILISTRLPTELPSNIITRLMNMHYIADIHISSNG